MWWPYLDKQLEELARACPGCKEKRAAPPHSADHPWKWTRGTWQSLLADFAELINGTMLLIVVDNFFKWIETISIRSLITAQTISKMYFVADLVYTYNYALALRIWGPSSEKT